MSGITQLQAELGRIDRLIEAAAVAEDSKEFIRLEMRRSAIPSLVREARCEPLRGEICELEKQLESLDDEALRAQQEPHVVLEGRRQHVTPTMIRNSRLASITDRTSTVSKRVKEKRAQLKRIESEGTVTPH